MIDSGTVRVVVDAAHQLLPALGAFVAAEASQRSPEDDGLIRQLRVAVGALNMALNEVPRFVPPPPAFPPPQAATADGTQPATA